MKNRRICHFLISVVLLTVILLSAGATEARAAGPITPYFPEGWGTWKADVACGTPVYQDIGEAGRYNGFTFPFAISSYSDCQSVSITFTLPEGFSFNPPGMEIDRQQTGYIGGVWANSAQHNVGVGGIYPLYLPDAEPGKQYYLEMLIEGDIVVDDDYRYPFSQTASIPFFTVEDAWDTVEINDPTLGACSVTWSESMITDAYNQDAAQMCAVLSHLAYDKSAIYDFFIRLGCEDIQDYGLGDTNDINNMGRYFAKKVIWQNGKQRNLIFAVGRGTTGELEWVGNLNVGTTELHRGFRSAAFWLNWGGTQSWYRKGNNVEDESFVFFTGHSKAAAAANIAAHWANRDGFDCVAYTFATPSVEQGIGTTASGEKGIYNFVFYQDVIRNAPSMAQFGRYGSTRIFGFEIPAVDPNAGPASTWTDGYGVQHLTWNGFTEQEILNAMAYDLDAAHGFFRSLKGLIQLRNQFLDAGNLLSYFTQNFKQCHSMRVYMEAVRRNVSCEPLDAIDQRTRDAIGAYLEIEQTAMADHVVHTICCPVDVYVYHADGTLAGSIIDNQVTVNRGEIMLGTMGVGKVVVFPRAVADSYSIEIEGYADGAVTHAAVYLGENGPEEMVYQENIPIANEQKRNLESEPQPGSGYAVCTDAAQMEELILSHAIPEAEGIIPFADVPEGEWYYDNVVYVYHNNLMNGVSDTEFAPAGTMTRAMLVTVLYRYEGQPQVSGGVPFDDLEEGSWYSDAVNWAYQNGIVNGTSATTFSPEAQITREQIVTIFYRYAASRGCETDNLADLSVYTDLASVMEYAQVPFRWAVANGIVNGTSATTLDPQSSATRSQCAAIIQRFSTFCG